jgi:phosphate transport system permease protein
MAVLLSLITFFLSCVIFSKKYYEGLKLRLSSSYVIPKRFYFYLLFILSSCLYFLFSLLFGESLHIFLTFAIIYPLFCIFLFYKGFDILGYAIIKIVEYCIEMNLLLFSVISILTVGLVFYSIFINSYLFFEQVGLANFFLKTSWTPENYEFDLEGSFGIIPLIINTLYITLFAILVSFFFGILIAVHLSEYIKSKKVRFTLKSIFEIIAGIPSIFYGFIGAFLLAPKLVRFASSFGVDVSIESIIVPGIAIGIMMIPYVATLLDDAFSAIPKTLKDASIAMGLTKFETVKKLIIPISLPEIISTLIIVVSRVLGETMIVLLTCGIVAHMTLSPLKPSTTITVQIVHLLTGDTSFESVKTLSVFALSLFLFIATMTLNIISIRIKNKAKKL